MSEGASQQRLPRRVDVPKMVYAVAVVAGYVDPEDLSRFSQVVECKGNIQVRLSFSVNDAGKWIVDLHLAADLRYQCQRCMQLMSADRVEWRSTLGIVWSEEEEKLLDSALDPWLLTDEEADLYDCIEDELLLNLPVVSYHDYVCVDLSAMSSGEDENINESKKESPFSVLSSLKQKGD